MFRSTLYTPDGDAIGAATYALMIRLGKEILVGNSRRFHVRDVVLLDEEDQLPLVGCSRSLADSTGGLPRTGARCLLASACAPMAESPTGIRCGCS